MSKKSVDFALTLELGFKSLRVDGDNLLLIVLIDLRLVILLTFHFIFKILY